MDSTGILFMARVVVKLNLNPYSYHPSQLKKDKKKEEIRLQMYQTSMDTTGNTNIQSSSGNSYRPRRDSQEPLSL